MAKQAALITTAQVAALLSLSIPTVNRYALSGRLPCAQKLPGKQGAYLFDAKVVEKFRAERVAA